MNTLTGQLMNTLTRGYEYSYKHTSKVIVEGWFSLPSQGTPRLAQWRGSGQGEVHVQPPETASGEGC